MASLTDAAVAAAAAVSAKYTVALATSHSSGEEALFDAKCYINFEHY